MSGVVVLGLFAVLLVRLYSIQVIQGPQLLASARQTTTRQVTVAPPRGEILTRAGQELAGNRLEEVVTLDQATAKAHPEVIGRLAALLGVKATSIRSELAQAALGLGQLNPYAPVPVSPPTGVPAADILDIEENQAEFPGVDVAPTYERTYPQGSLASQIIGYVGDINASELKTYAKDGYTPQDVFGQQGLESQYELALRGTPGVANLEVDPSGAVVSQVSATAPRQGDAVVLNMDLGLDRLLSTALSNQIARLRAGDIPPNAVPADFGAAVVLDATSGAVLAMTSFPSYNDNLWVGGISQAALNQLTSAQGRPLNDYAIAGLQAPGSTFKLATATAALDDGLISPYTTYVDTGSYTIPGTVAGTTPTVLHNSNNEVLGPVNVSSALSKSSDVFFYNLGAQFWYGWSNHHAYGATPIQGAAESYGLGRPTGIDLPGEASGQVDSPLLRRQEHAAAPKAFPYTSYFVGDNVELAFGQGETLVTPLQVANAYATFANGGTRYEPQMAAALVSTSGQVFQKMKPKVEGHVHFGAGDYAAMLSGFEGTVQSSLGTAYGAFSGFDFSKWNVAGKTGTATPTSNAATQPTSWFVAFGGPRGETPRYVVAVEIDQGGYGADAAAPVARQVFDYLVKHPIAPMRLPTAKATKN